MKGIQSARAGACLPFSMSKYMLCMFIRDQSKGRYFDTFTLSTAKRTSSIVATYIDKLQF
jgi:hypothetical protein